MSEPAVRKDDILIRLLGDYGPFSREGKSIGYSIEVNGFLYLLDCGAPLFQQIGGHGLKNIRGVLITHCHDDHKRWFTDLALFKRYAPDVADRVLLVTAEAVFADLWESSRAALDRSLSADSATVVDIAFEDYVDVALVGPRARWRIEENPDGGSAGRYRVVDDEGDTAPPNRAKVVVHPCTGRPRLLFRDPDYGEWIEPESFYPYSSRTFYRDPAVASPSEGIRIEAIKDPVWHGVPSVGFRIATETSSVTFSSDTVNDPELWKRLSEERRPQRLPMSRKDFEASSLIHGDINDLIERTWSRERYEAARTAFAEGVIIHDVSTRYNAVHTDYGKLDFTCLDRERTILTHSPDRIVSEWCLGSGGKEFLVRGGAFQERVDGALYPMDADIFYKEKGRYFVGYRDTEGDCYVYEKAGQLDISRGPSSALGEFRFRVNLFEDIRGGYFQVPDKEGAEYRLRPDGRTELVRWTDKGSEGVIVESLRGNHGRGSSMGQKSRTSVVGI